MTEQPPQPSAQGGSDLERAIADRTFAHTVLTYNDQELRDGLGAQLQRVLGIHAMARVLGAPYLHTPVGHLEFVGLSNPGGRSEEMLARVESLLPMASDTAALELLPRARVERLNTLSVALAAPRRGTADEPALLRITMPYPHLEHQPDLWRGLGEVGFPASRAPHIRVALHVRRGELHLKPTSHDRLLPNSYYVAAAQRIGALLTRLGVSYRFELYTEAVDRPTSYSADRLHASHLATSLMITPEHDRIEEFDVLAPLDRFINTDPIDTLLGLATADVLITSKSSFSFVAGVLAPHNLVLYMPFWHHGLSDWVVTDLAGNFDEGRAERRIGRVLDARRQAAAQDFVARLRSA